MIDHVNKIMWPYDGHLGGFVSWYDGVDFATNLTLAGHSNWRLPKPTELRSLVDGDAPLYQLQFFGNTEVPGGGYPHSLAYWTSESVASNPGNAHYMHITGNNTSSLDNLGSYDKSQSGGAGTIRGWPVRYIDYDQDGLFDIDEINTHNTNPYSEDTDGDGFSDFEEIQNGTDPLVADSDSDGLSDHVEINTYGSNPYLEDTDGDGLSDYAESTNTYYEIVEGIFTWEQARVDAIQKTAN